MLVPFNEQFVKTCVVDRIRLRHITRLHALLSILPSGLVILGRTGATPRKLPPCPVQPARELTLTGLG